MAPMVGNLLGTTDKRPKPSPQILPDELIEEILVRVPASTLVRLKIVCKSWNGLICSSEFARFHLERSRSDPRLVYGFEHDHRMRFVPMQSVFKNPSAFTIDASIKMDRDLQILGSCNGLICIGSMRKRKGLLHLKSIRLCNPCTRSASDWLKIKGQKGNINMCGFGYDEVHDNYKFLYGHKIHILGSKNSWKRIIQDPPSYEPKAAIGTFVKGSLNWAAHAGSKWVILYFDLGNNRFLPLSLPDLDSKSQELYGCDPGVDVLRDRLCVCLMIVKHNGWVLWVMEEYGIEESWTRLFNIICEVRGHRGPFKALYMTQDGDAAVTVFGPGDHINSYGIGLKGRVWKPKKIYAGPIKNYIYYMEGVGHQNLYVYHETLLSPSRLGLPSFNY